MWKCDQPFRSDAPTVWSGHYTVCNGGLAPTPRYSGVIEPASLQSAVINCTVNHPLPLFRVTSALQDGAATPAPCHFTVVEPTFPGDGASLFH